MEGRAEIKFIRTSPRKLRYVVDAVRGKRVGEILGILALLEQRAALVVEKAVKSALSGIREKARQEKKTVDFDELLLAEAVVSAGPTTKRFRARAFGRATPIRKRSSHLKIVLKEEK